MTNETLENFRAIVSYDAHACSLEAARHLYEMWAISCFPINFDPKSQTAVFTGLIDRLLAEYLLELQESLAQAAVERLSERCSQILQIHAEVCNSIIYSSINANSEQIRFLNSRMQPPLQVCKALKLVSQQ